MRVEITHIGGDIYVNGVKVAFAIDFVNPPKPTPEFRNVEWLLGWAKIGLMSLGHEVPHFETRDTKSFDAVPVEAAVVPQPGERVPGPADEEITVSEIGVEPAYDQNTSVR